MIKFSKKYNLFLTFLFYAYGFLNSLLFKFQLSVIYYHYEKKILNLINNLRSSGDLLLTVVESLQVYECARSAQKIKGDFAEVGVYRGGSAVIISEVKKGKKFHLFDTFEGLPDNEKIDSLVGDNSMVSNLDEVKSKLKRYKNVYFYKGLFPKTGNKIKKDKFAFVHLDVDLYRSTINSLKFFYPKMSKGGIILSHDYPFMPGVKRAFDEFFENRRELVLKLSGNQAIVIKI